MSLILVLAGIGLLVLPGRTAVIGARLRPGEWSRLAMASTWLGLRATQLGLFLLAAPTVLRGIGIEDLADACHRVLGPIMPGGALSGWAAAVAFTALLLRGRQVRRDVVRAQRLARIEPWLGEHRPMPAGSLVVLPCDQLLAYAAPGSPMQIVVSQGLVDTLAADELDAVIGHELAHVHCRHDRYLLTASMVDGVLGWCPGVRASTAALRLAIERCADEDAGAPPVGRDAVRRALERVTETLLAPVPAFTAAWTISQRLLALAEAPPEPTVVQRVAVRVPMAALTVVVAVALVAWSAATHHGPLGLVGFCPL